MLFSEPKIPQSIPASLRMRSRCVSVLFSEPKIPQSVVHQRSAHLRARFSALQRAENSSMFERYVPGAYVGVFQCSSASRKFLNPRGRAVVMRVRPVSVLFSEPKIPQSVWYMRRRDAGASFSALQRAENSSIAEPPASTCCRSGFSALQRAENSSIQ